MKKMSELQPKIRSIQDRYKRLKRDDPRKQDMNAEMMALYKEHGVNPARRLPAAARPDALFVRFLPDAGFVVRIARRAVHAVDQRPVEARSVLRHADRHGRHHAAAADDDAAHPDRTRLSAG